MLRDAELAMHYAKRHGGDRIEAFRATTRSIAVMRRRLEDDLAEALESATCNCSISRLSISIRERSWAPKR